jgi:hypothetical protein
MGGLCSTYGGSRGVYRFLVGKTEGRGELGRPRSMWDDNIKMDLQEVGSGVWTGSSWLRIGTVWRATVNAVVNIRVPSTAGNFLTS